MVVVVVVFVVVLSDNYVAYSDFDSGSLCYSVFEDQLILVIHFYDDILFRSVD